MVIFGVSALERDLVHWDGTLEGCTGMRLWYMALEWDFRVCALEFSIVGCNSIEFYKCISGGQDRNVSTHNLDSLFWMASNAPVAVSRVLTSNRISCLISRVVSIVTWLSLTKEVKGCGVVWWVWSAVSNYWHMIFLSIPHHTSHTSHTRTLEQCSWRFVSSWIALVVRFHKRETAQTA